MVIYTSVGIFSGEDQRTIVFMFGLSLILSILIILYNLILTLIGVYIFRIVDFPIGPFLFPTLAGVIFNKYFINLIAELDMGAHKFYWLIIIIGLVINLSAYYFTVKKNLIKT